MMGVCSGVSCETHHALAHVSKKRTFFIHAVMRGCSRCDFSYSKAIANHSRRLRLHRISAQHRRTQVLLINPLASDRMSVVERHDPGVRPKTLVILHELVRTQRISIADRLGERWDVIGRCMLPAFVVDSVPEESSARL